MRSTLPLLCALTSTVAFASADPVSWYLSAPRTRDASLDLEITEGPVHSQATLDLVTTGGAVNLRAQVTGGPKKGEAALVELAAPGGKDRYYAFKPALGASAVTWGQLEHNFHELGVSLGDLVNILQPVRAGTGWTGGAQGAGALLQAPVDAHGCSDAYRFASLSVALPAEVSFCAAEAWSAHKAKLSGQLKVDGATLPQRIEITEGSRVVDVSVAVASTPRWQDPSRFDRATLGR